jgi:hypothetical protein
MSESKRWIITTSGDRPLDEVKKELTGKGFAIGQVLDEIGCIIGEASDDTAKKLRAVPGVADVSPDEPINIAPPDSDITW